MDKELVLKMAIPHVKEGYITYQDFDHIYHFLSLHEQYQVIEILFENNIQLKDGKNEKIDEFDESVILDEFDENLFTVDTSKQEDNLEVLDDKNLFKDNAFNQADNYVVLYKDIKQSNSTLCSLIQQGSQQARQDICVKNERLVMKIAQRYSKSYGNDLDFEDLMQAGYIGLLKAADKFNITSENQFSTYAVWWIRQAISREIIDHGYTVRIPVHMMEKITKIMALDIKYDVLELDYHERINKIALDLNLAPEEVTECLALRKQFLYDTSLNTPIGEDEETELEDFIEDSEQESIEDVIIQESLSKEVKRVLSTLSAKESLIIQHRFGLLDNQPKTLEEIGQIFGVTRERIRQIEAKALRKLRQPKRSKILKDFNN